MIPEYLDVPIFPLPNATLFPNTVLPLHIFEPRYRQMTANCLRGDRMMAIALLNEGWQKDYFGRPPIHKTFGVGKIVDHELLDDGRYNIVLEGAYRAKLVEEYPHEPYRVGHVMVLQDRRIDDRRAEVVQLQKEIFEDCRRVMTLLPETRESIQSAWSSHPHPAVIADMLASSLVADPYDRQSILTESDPVRRLGLTLIQVRRILHHQAQKEIQEKILEEE